MDGDAGPVTDAAAAADTKVPQEPNGGAAPKAAPKEPDPNLFLCC